MRGALEISFVQCDTAQDLVVDATCAGSLGRFINHSCQPNCVTEKW